MRKIGLLLGIMLFALLLHTTVKADESVDNLLINGLDTITTEYEAGINPSTINFTEGLALFENTGTLAPDKLLVDTIEVDFNKVGTYNVYYYVIYMVDNQEVRVNLATLPIQIVDHTLPVLHGVHTIYAQLNTTSPINYLTGVTATDNDKSSPLDIKVFNQSVDITQDGIYHISYFVTDKSGNSTIENSLVVIENPIVDQNKPIITVSTSQFIFKQNEENPNYLNSVSATDGDIDLTSYVQYDDSGVDYATIGDYEVYFMVFDDDGNFTEVSVPVSIVVDNDPPTFTNLKDGDTIDLTINTTDLKQNIEATDAVCGDMTSRITVELGLNFSFSLEGEYPVVYSVSDLNGNTTSVHVTVHVFDNIPPVITAPKTLYLSLNDTLDLVGKITVTDNYDAQVNYQLENNNLDPSKVGTYMLDVTAEDQAGNIATSKIMIYVYDSTKVKLYENPIILGSLVGIGASGIVIIFGYVLTKGKRRR